MSRPSARKQAKKHARATVARAKMTARRAARAKAAPPNPSRNLHVERGRQVTVDDIRPYARQKCGKCAGKGIAGLRTIGEDQGAEPCVCATKRFFARHAKKLIVDQDGRAWWPAEPPAAPAAEAAPDADG